jgi:hypothetical protein
MSQFMGVMTDPFMGRGGSLTGSSAALGYAEEDGRLSAYAASGKSTDAFAMFTKAAPFAKIYEPRWSVWASGFGGSQSTDGNVALGSNNTTSSIAGTAVGADYLLSPNTLVGFALGGGGTNFSVANGGTGRSDLFQAGAYLFHTSGAAYVSAALAYGWQDVTTNRVVTAAGLRPAPHRVQCQCVFGTRRRRLPPCSADVGWRIRSHALCGGAVRHLRSAGLCRTGDHRPQYLCVVLWRA